MPHQSAISALGAFLKALEEEKIPCILIATMRPSSRAHHSGPLITTSGQAARAIAFTARQKCSSWPGSEPPNLISRPIQPIT